MKFHKTERFMHMNDFILSCCSTADLTEEHFNSRNISYICFHYELNGKEYEDDLGKSVPFDQFYLALQNGASAKTSQVNADQFCCCKNFFICCIQFSKTDIVFYRSCEQMCILQYNSKGMNRPEAVVSPDTLATQWYVRLAQGTLEGERLTIPGAAEGESGFSQRFLLI